MNISLDDYIMKKNPSTGFQKGRMAQRLGKKQSPGKVAVQIHNKKFPPKKPLFEVTGLAKFDARQKLSNPKALDARQKLQQKPKLVDARTRIQINKTQHHPQQQNQASNVPKNKVANLSTTDMRIKINNAKGKKMDAREMLKAKRGLKQITPGNQESVHLSQTIQNDPQQSRMNMANTKVILTDSGRMVGQGGASGVIVTGNKLVKTIPSSNVATWDNSQAPVPQQSEQPGGQFQRRGQLHQQQPQHQPQHQPPHQLQHQPHQQSQGMMMQSSAPFSKTISNPPVRTRIGQAAGNNIVFNTSQSQQQRHLQQQQAPPPPQPRLMQQFHQQPTIESPPPQQDQYTYSHYEFDVEPQQEYDLNQDFPIVQIENDSYQTYPNQQVDPTPQYIQPPPQRIHYNEPVRQQAQIHFQDSQPLMQRIQPETPVDPQQHRSRPQVLSHSRNKVLISKPKASPIRFPSSPEKNAEKKVSPLTADVDCQDDSIKLEGTDTVSPLQGYRILITNLHTIVTQDDVVELFGAVGALKKARLIKPGTGEVVYVKREDALAAVRKYHQRELDGKPMQVAMTTQNVPKPKPPIVEPESKPLTLGKTETSSQESSSINVDVGLLHKALFKTVNKDDQPTKPVTFTVKI